MILVTGAAGKTGRALIQDLLAKKEPIRAFVHHSGQVSQLKATGVLDIVVGDFHDNASLSRAAQGVRAIYHIPPNVAPHEISIGKAVIRAARDAHVEHFFYHSVLHPHIKAMPHHWKKLLVEELLIGSGLNYTILQPAVYMQNLLSQWDNIVKNGIYSIPYARETQLSFVDLEDVAQVAALVMTEDGHQDATYELVGTPALSQIEVAGIITKNLDQHVEVKEIPIEVWERTSRASGLGNYQVSTLIKMFMYYQQNGFGGNPKVLTGLLGRQPNSIHNFLSRIRSGRQNGH